MASVAAVVRRGLRWPVLVALALLATACQPGWYTTVAGTGYSYFSGDGGPAVDAQVQPAGLAVDASGNLFIADRGNDRIRRVDAATKVITTVAGDGSATSSGDGGPATAAGLAGPASVAVDASGDLYIGEAGRVRRVDAMTGTITTIVGDGTQATSGDGGPASAARVGTPLALEIGPDGDLYVVDGSRVRRVDLVTGTITTVAGGGPTAAADGVHATDAAFESITAIAFDAAGDLHVVDGRIWRIAQSGSALTLLAGGGGAEPVDGGAALDTTPTWLCLAFVDDHLIAGGQTSDAYTIDPVTSTLALIPASGRRPFQQNVDTFPGAMAANGSEVFLSEPVISRVEQIDVSTGVVQAVAGIYTADDWTGLPARSVPLEGVLPSATTDGAGNSYFAVFGQAVLWKVDATTGALSIANGESDLRFGSPALLGLTTDLAGDVYYFNLGDLGIHKVDAATGTVSLIGAGTYDTCSTIDDTRPDAGAELGDGGPASEAAFCLVEGMATDSVGDLFVADALGRVRRIDHSTGIVTTIAGGGTTEPVAGPPVPATSVEMHPQSVAFAPDGTLWIAGDDRIYNVDRRGLLTVRAGTGPGDPPAAGGLTPIGAVDQVAVDTTGTVYFASSQFDTVQRMRPSTGSIDDIASPQGTSTDASGNLGRREVELVSGLHCRGRDLYFIDTHPVDHAQPNAVLLHVVDASDAPSVESLGG